MTDTAPEVVGRMEEMFRQKTPAERLSMGCSMFDLSRELVRSSILRVNPDISPVLLRKELFLRFYSDDLDSSQQKKIIQHWMTK